MLFEFLGGIDEWSIFPNVEILNERVFTLELSLKRLLFWWTMIEHDLKCEFRFKHPTAFEVIMHPIENIGNQIHLLLSSNVYLRVLLRL